MNALDFESILGPGGSISRRIANYEHRREQLQMAQAVTQALDAKKHLIVEAGTGVGKSFGYLVPAILYATADEGRLDDQENPSDQSAKSSDSDEDDKSETWINSRELRMRQM